MKGTLVQTLQWMSLMSLLLLLFWMPGAAACSYQIASPCDALPGRQKECAGKCVEILKDNQHCGACQNACPKGKRCEQGRCELYCEGELKLCGRVCKRINWDNLNCGKCGHVCQQGLSCSNGKCIPQWASFVSGETLKYERDSAKKLAVDGKGNAYIWGKIHGKASTQPPILRGVIEKGSTLIKVNAQGVFQWGRRLESFNSFDIFVAGDSLGNAYLAASWSVSASPTERRSELFIQKLDEDGKEIWKKSFGYADVKGLRAGKDGAMYICGTFSKQAVFGSSTLKSSGLKDIFVAKLDKRGHFVWAKRGGGIADDGVHSFAVDVDGNIYISGGFGDKAHFGPKSLTAEEGFFLSGRIYVVKLDAKGRYAWAVNLGVDYRYSVSGVGADGKGGVYVTARVKNTQKVGKFKLTDQVFVAKLASSNGKFVWLKAYEGKELVFGERLVVDLEGNVFLWGAPREDSIFGTKITRGKGHRFLAKVSPEGDVLWAGKFDFLFGGMAVDPGGRLYFSGILQSPIQLGSVTLKLDYIGDIFVSRGFP